MNCPGRLQINFCWLQSEKLSRYENFPFCCKQLFNDFWKKNSCQPSSNCPGLEFISNSDFFEHFKTKSSFTEIRLRRNRKTFPITWETQNIYITGKFYWNCIFDSSNISLPLQSDRWISLKSPNWPKLVELMSRSHSRLIVTDSSINLFVLVTSNRCCVLTLCSD